MYVCVLLFIEAIVNASVCALFLLFAIFHTPFLSLEVQGIFLRVFHLPPPIAEQTTTQEEECYRTQIIVVMAVCRRTTPEKAVKKQKEKQNKVVFFCCWSCLSGWKHTEGGTQLN